MNSQPISTTPTLLDIAFVCGLCIFSVCVCVHIWAAIGWHHQPKVCGYLQLLVGLGV